MITLRAIDCNLLIGKFETMDEVLEYCKESVLYDCNNTYID